MTDGVGSTTRLRPGQKVSIIKKLADRLLQAAPLAARATKEVAARGRYLPWVEAVRFGETMRLVAGNTADAAEGRAAFRDKRAPHWQGK